MKQYRIVEAYEVIKGFSRLNFRIKDAYAIYQLLEELKPAVIFQIEQERDLFEQNNIQLGSDGSIIFSDNLSDEDKRHVLNIVQARINELREFDNKIEFHPITLSYCALDNVRISPENIKTLSGFITFTE